MKATDLMIGDWVFCDGKCYQIAEIGGMVCLDAENELYASLEDIKPIPLTQQILEKNDFVFVSDVGYKFDDYLGGIVTCDIWNQDITVLYNYKVIYSCDYVSFCVHSLQHILRLCMIDKEITL